MIELRISGCCAKCKYIDLDLKGGTIYCGLEPVNMYAISCRHEKVCAALEKEASDGKTNENV